MIYKPEEITDKKGETCIFRSLKQEDADELRRFVEIGATETPYFPWTPGYTELTADNAEEYILDFEKDPRRLLLGAFRDGRLLGVNELSGMGQWEGMRHRCMVGGGILKEAQGRGLGRKLTLTIAAVAKEIGYEQLEASSATHNNVSKENLRGMDFKEYGMIPHKYKNKDGSYVDELRFVKWL
jgi:ribosomal protein S18 acetylase RimI-like enzyme